MNPLMILKKIPVINLLCVVALLFIVSVAQAQAPLIFRERLGQDQAGANQCTGTVPTVCISLDMQQYLESGPLVTQLGYSVTTITGRSFQQIYGFGTIPNESFSVQGDSGSARLAVNTIGLPAFSNGVCTISGCWYDPQVGGLIAVEWTKNGLISYVAETSQRTTTLGQTEHDKWSRHQESADAFGNVVGYPIDTATFGSPGDSFVLHDQNLTTVK